MKEHVSSTHKVKAAEHKTSPLWRECTLQTYFVGRGRVKYFVVVDNKNEEKINILELSTPLKKEEKALFIKLEKDYQHVNRDIEEQASIVHDFADSRSERVPWPERVEFPSHTATLKDEEIWSSYKLLPKKEVDGGAEGATDPNLTPGALISPYLWSKSDGTVWADDTLAACLAKACTRAQVPRFKTARWRQFAASITKEKFAAKERANFDMEDNLGDDIEDELDLVVLAELSNHSYHTFNHAEKRPRGMSDTLSLRMLDASKRGQMRRKGAYSEADLLTVARKLHSAPNMKFRVPGQRRGVLAVMGPQPAEQVVLILGTGSGKTLVFQVGAMAADARTTILILPAVVLRGDMLRRCQLVGIQPLIWSRCTEGFLEYAHTLVRGQELDRIVVDESQLTITASDYRPCISQLGWYVRQIRTQTVWLTATLPPVMQEEFIEQNKLVRPTIIRESTNRPNIKYLISLEDGSGTLLEKAVTLVRTCWPRRDIFDHAKDKIIIYCRTRLEVRGLQELLGCPAYMSEWGSEEEKREIINGWLGDAKQPAIVATSALGIGLDYPHVRWVIHVDAPDKMTDFSQESGRAGRDGRAATSIVMIRSHWKPQSGG
ncbi:hypothetical protein V501_02521, partial [Pseudogymnoascus sp. VKM F-4519 (FW-2642)]